MIFFVIVLRLGSLFLQRKAPWFQAPLGLRFLYSRIITIFFMSFSRLFLVGILLAVFVSTVSAFSFRVCDTYDRSPVDGVLVPGDPPTVDPTDSSSFSITPVKISPSSQGSGLSSGEVTMLLRGGWVYNIEEKTKTFVGPFSGTKRENFIGSWLKRRNKVNATSANTREFFSREV